MTDLRETAVYSDEVEPAPEPRRLRYNPRSTRGDGAFRDAERNTRRVRALRFILPGIAILAIVVFWASARFIPGDMESLVEVSGIDTTSNSVVMQNPHISGFEGTRRAYEVKAASAVQSLDDPKIVTFNTIDGKFGLDGAGEATLNATVGVYDGNRNILTLSDGIRVTTNTGYSGSLEGASIDLGAGSLSSNTPLEIVTDQGSVRAGAVAVVDRGKRVTFSDGVSVVYRPPAELVTRSGLAGDLPAVESQE